MSRRVSWGILVAAVGCASGAADSSGPPTDDFSEEFGGAAGAGGDAGGSAGAAGSESGGGGSAGKASGGGGTSSGGSSSGGAGTSSGGAGASSGGAGSAGKGGAGAGGASAGTGGSAGAGKGGASGGAAGTSGGAAGTSGGAAGSAGSAGGSGCSHKSANCAGPDSLGEIAGDAGSDSIVRTGTDGAAFSLLVREASSNIIPNDLALKASLDVPAGMVYKLDVSWIPGGTCPGTPLGPVGATAWSTSWSDTPGSDDSRLLLFEVKYVSGNLCADASKWTLTIVGNQ